MQKSKTVKQILAMTDDEVMKLDERTLRRYVQTLADAGNKRLTAFNEQSLTGNAVSYIKRHGGRFTTKNKKLGALRSEFVRAKGFLEAKTGTLRGYKQTMNYVIEELQKRGIGVSQKQYEDYWYIYGKLKELDRSVATKPLKYYVLHEIKVQMDVGKSADVIISDIHKRVKDIYEESRKNDGHMAYGKYFSGWTNAPYQQSEADK